MKKLYTLLFLSTLFTVQLKAQYFDVGAFVGTSNYMGDLVGSIPEGPEYHPAYGIFGRYNLNKISTKIHFYKGEVSGSDYYSTVKSGRRKRNLSFESPLYELGLQFEFNFFQYRYWTNKNSTTPYLFAGFSGFYFNPKAEYNGTLYELQPLGTEGQGLPGNPDPYSLFSFAIPMGAGLKLSISKTTNIGMEVGVRSTFTDYLDDVSTNYPDLASLEEVRGATAAALSFRSPEYDQSYLITDPSGKRRGGPDVKDWYLFAGLTISVNLGIKKNMEEQKKKMTPKRKPKIEF